MINPGHGSWDSPHLLPAMIRFDFIRGFGLTNAFICVIWAIAIAWGLIILFNYGHRPGEQGVTPQQWPNDTGIAFSGERPIVLFFAHPHCPCTHASLRELEHAAAVSQYPTDFVLVSLDCRPDCSEWKNSSLVSNAERIPGLKVVWDRNGLEANRFGVKTSGHVVAYSRNGRVGFSGGVTGSRGHQGSNHGRSALERWLQMEPAWQDLQQQTAFAPVFGCTMMEEADD